ncbi:hypothetical protein HO173_009567 [Letharia columbiana]|uniref:WW domain-containing protein n=1 Tax=Letharia columbiana TaxID=112416 RepID=A0A8H6FP98_9LECA|nr:uncharacterized protein HO173_009567 [Letharia columbiana]KAF6232184.1 hypothetical protein HO173_009567 [Letharia columbiana]
MADFIPPSGPPPPKVPEGWKAQWNDQYKEWFYVNIHTKQSTWDRPTSPVYPTAAGAPPGPPPSYPGAGNTTAGGSSTYPAGAGANTYPPEKGLGSNNPYGGPQGASSHQDLDEDARYAQQLQAEEDARARAAGRPTSSEALDRGESDSYYQGGAQQGGAYGQGQGQSPSYDAQQLPPRDAGKKGGLGGFLSKLGGRHNQPQQSPYGQQGGLRSAGVRWAAAGVRPAGLWAAAAGVRRPSVRRVSAAGVRRRIWRTASGRVWWVCSSSRLRRRDMGWGPVGERRWGWEEDCWVGCCLVKRWMGVMEVVMGATGGGGDGGGGGGDDGGGGGGDF